MSRGELSFDPTPSPSVTWTIPDFFTLAPESGYSIQSPHFPFPDGRYYLRLFRTWDSSKHCIGIQLLNLINTDPGKAVLYEVLLKSRTEEIRMFRNEYNKNVFLFYRSKLENERDLFVPHGTLTVLCSVRLRKPSRAGSPKSDGAQTQVIPKYTMTGELSIESFPFLYATWRIPRFSKLQSMHPLQSPEFPFYDHRYCLRLFWTRPEVNIQLVNLTDTVPGSYVSYEVGLKSKDGEEIGIGRRDTSNRREFYISRYDLDGKKSECFPHGHLNVFCCMLLRKPISAESPKSVGAETPGSKASAPPKSGGAQTSNEEEGKEEFPAFNKMLKDMKRLLASEENSDVSLVVGGKEFLAHRTILCSKSPVFKAMLCPDTSESDSGTVSIEDCDPDGFQDFLTYVYTGSTGHIDAGNVISLYATSDRYLVRELKEACVFFMKNNMSVEGFCGIATLALRHDDNELIEAATKFFCENAKEIIETETWTAFLEENPKEANEHFIKPLINRW